MELRAVIHGLQALNRPCQVDVWTDSRYLHDALNQGWLRRWEQNGWQTKGKKAVKNQDLWRELSSLFMTHKVHLHWVRGHSGHPENERCDLLAKEAAQGPDLPADSPGGP
jgi:ribonuclease HI